jgi:hypothetical protein
MSIINFAVAETLEQKISRAIRKYGFATKAEFLRFMIIDFFRREEREEDDDGLGEMVFADDPKIARLTNRLGMAMSKIDPKTLPPVEEQFKKLEALK